MNTAIPQAMANRIRLYRLQGVKRVNKSTAQIPIGLLYNMTSGVLYRKA